MKLHKLKTSIDLSLIKQKLGIEPSFVDKDSFIKSIQSGNTVFKRKTFTNFSIQDCLKLYPNLNLQLDFRYSDISLLEDLNFVIRNYDCTGCKIRGANLSGNVLSHARLAKADLQNAILVNTILTGANLNGARLNNANLSSAVLDECNLGNSSLKKANLFEANGIGTNLKEALFAGANLKHFFIDGEEFKPQVKIKTSLHINKWLSIMIPFFLTLYLTIYLTIF